MKKLSLVILIAVFAAGCNLKDLPTEFPTPPPIAPATPLEKMTLKPDAELEKQIAKIAEAAKGKVGVAAVLLETGDAAMLNGGERFPMQSVYKLPISMAVMDQIRRGELALDEKIGVIKEDMVREGQRSPLRDKNPNGGEFTIRELIRLALIESDGTASDVLMHIAGGSPQIQNFLTQIGIKNIRVVNTEKQLALDWQTQYLNYSTPTDAVELLRWLQTSTANTKKFDDDGLSEKYVPDKANDEIVMWFMAGSTPGAKRLKGNLPPDTVVAHKTGTSGTQNGITAATNDIGIIALPNGNHIAIAVFVSDSPTREQAREEVIANVAKAVWDRWSNLPGTPLKGEIQIDVSSIRLGNSLAEVREKIGPPEKIENQEEDKCANEMAVTIHYPGLTLYLLGKSSIQHFTVASIDVRSGGWVASGIPLGSTVEEVILKFGEPNSRSAGDEVLYYVHKGNDGGINFEFVDGRLSKFSVNTTLC